MSLRPNWVKNKNVSVNQKVISIAWDLRSMTVYKQQLYSSNSTRCLLTNDKNERVYTQTHSEQYLPTPFAIS